MEEVKMLVKSVPSDEGNRNPFPFLWVQKRTFGAGLDDLFPIQYHCTLSYWSIHRLLLHHHHRHRNAAIVFVATRGQTFQTTVSDRTMLKEAFGILSN